MPKANHIHTTRDVVSTDRKFWPNDEGVIAKQKQEFQQSEQDKQVETRSEEEFITEQDKNNES